VLQLAVRQVPRPLSSFVEVGVATGHARLAAVVILILNVSVNGVFQVV